VQFLGDDRSGPLSQNHAEGSVLLGEARSHITNVDLLKASCKVNVGRPEPELSGRDRGGGTCSIRSMRCPGRHRVSAEIPGPSTADIRPKRWEEPSAVLDGQCSSGVSRITLSGSFPEHADLREIVRALLSFVMIADLYHALVSYREKSPGCPWGIHAIVLNRPLGYPQGENSASFVGDVALADLRPHHFILKVSAGRDASSCRRRISKRAASRPAVETSLRTA